MNATIQQEVIKRLINDFSFKEREQYLQQGVCPACQKKELFTSIEKPWMLKCGRENKCGKEILVKELYRDIFEDWSKRYQPTPEAPDATAEAYLREARGLDTSKLKGCYKQGSFIKNNLGSATVKFKLANGSCWERIIDQPSRFSQKANFIGNYAGYWWEYPGLNLAEQKEIWITEGIFNAIALNEAGKAAVATLSSVNYPKTLLDMLAETLGDKPRPRLVWAFDDDRAGRSHIEKFARRARDAGWEVSAALPSENGSSLDWNDLHLRERLEHSHFLQYRHYGRLLLADSPAAKALEMHNHNGWRTFHFTFRFRTYWFELDFEKFSRAFDRIQQLEGVFDEDLVKQKAIKESGSLEEIANCIMQPLYYQVSKPTDEAWYYLRVMAPNMPTVKSTFTASQLTSSAEFKKRLLHMAKGALFTGTTKQLDIIFRSLQSIKEVNTMNWLGFNKDHNAWVFNDVAISKGRVFTLNEEDYFDIDKLSIKSLSLTPSLNLNVDLRDFETNWVNDIWTAFGEKGYVALAFWLGSLFAEQLRQRNKSYPFLEIVGEPGTGKSTLIEFLWKLCGREEYEGFDPSKSTAAARGRNFSQVANLPVVLIEGDRQSVEGKTKNLRAFDYDELKSLYNGRASRALGIKTNNNETYEPPFKGAIVIAQNADVDGSEALLSRLIHIATDRSGQTPETTAAAVRLEQIPVQAVSGFLIKATSMADELLAEYDKHLAIAQQQFKAQGIIKTNRISLNHAQIQALLAALPMVVPVQPERIQHTWKYVVTLAEERQRALNQDHPLVQEFWEMFDYLDSQESAGMNHSAISEPGEIAVNFNHFEEVAAHYRQRLNFAMVDIKKLLKHGNKRKYLRTCSVRSDVSKQFNMGKETTYRRPETYYCWVFSRER